MHRLDLKNHEVSYLFGAGTKTTTADRLTPLKAVRATCLDCSAGSALEAKLCVVTTCPLWVYRLGKRPASVAPQWLNTEYVKAAGLKQCCVELVRESGDGFKQSRFHQESQETIAARMKPESGREGAECPRRGRFYATDDEDDTLTV